MERNQTMVIIAVVLLLVIGVLAAVAFMQPDDESDELVVPRETASPMASPSPTDVDPSATETPDGMESDETNDDGEANIEVESPRPQDELTLPFTIEGRARVFENTIQYSVEEATGQVLADGFATADSPDVGEFGDFSIEIDEWETAPDPNTTGYVRVFSESARDGSEINVVRVPVTFLE